MMESLATLQNYTVNRYTHETMYESFTIRATQIEKADSIRALYPTKLCLSGP